MTREQAIVELSEITGTGFFGERHGGWLSREDAERFVDALLDGSAAAMRALKARHANVVAALGTIAGGQPAAKLEPWVARHHLELAQRSAELALLEDEASAEETAKG